MATSGFLEITGSPPIHRCAPFKNNHSKGVMFFWDKRFLKPGSVIEISQPMAFGNNVVVPFEFENGMPAFLKFSELSPENQKDVRKQYPTLLGLLWIN